MYWNIERRETERGERERARERGQGERREISTVMQYEHSCDVYGKFILMHS